MSDKDRRATKTVRELARIAFANARTLLLCLLVGGGLGFWKASSEDRTYRGKIDLAAGSPQSQSRVALPDEVRLRQLIYDPANLVALLPTEVKEEARDREQELSSVERSIVVAPVLRAAGDARSVWQVVAEIHATSPEDAQSRLTAYVNQLQDSFAAKRLLSRLPEEPTIVEANSPVFALLSVFLEGNGAGDEMPETAEPLPKTAEESLSRLQKRAATLNVHLPSINSEINAVSSELDSLDLKLSSANMSRETAQHYRDMLQSERSIDWFISEFPKKHVEVAKLSQTLADLRRTRLLLSATATAANPMIARLDREIAKTQEHLAKGLEAANKDYLDEIAMHEAREDKILAEIKANKDRLDQLEKLDEEWMLHQERFSKSAKATAEAALPSPPPSTMPTKEPEGTRVEALPAGRLLVAGPFVDPSPYRPRTLRDVLLGSVMGLAFGVFYVMLRTASDQRIHVAADVEDLDLELEVFGSIPQLKGEQPVRWTGETPAENTGA